jgi:hypothetical protein
MKTEFPWRINESVKSRRDALARVFQLLIHLADEKLHLDAGDKEQNDIETLEDGGDSREGSSEQMPDG